MLKIVLIGISIIAIAMVVISCTTKKQNEYVLGKEMAAADKKEEERLNSKNLTKSPLKQKKYSDFDSGRTLQNPREVELDSEIIQLVTHYLESDEDERSEIRKSLSQDDIYTIFSFCERATVFGLRKQNENIQYGLNTLSMVDAERCDFRDALVSIAFVNHGIEKLHLNADKLYEEAIKNSNPRMKELLSSFEERKAKDKAIETMAGYTEYQFENGIGFVRCGYEAYNPKSDLPTIAFSIGKVIGKDKYHIAEDVSIAESLPMVWIEGQSENQIKELLNQSMGTVRLNAYLREEFTKDWVSQMFLFHLVEFEDANKANQFKNLLGEEGKETFARIFGSVENIFYILISRSTTIGIEDYETNESLQRFKEIIERELKKENSH